MFATIWRAVGARERLGRGALRVGMLSLVLGLAAGTSACFGERSKGTEGSSPEAKAGTVPAVPCEERQPSDSTAIDAEEKAPAYVDESFEPIVPRQLKVRSLWPAGGEVTYQKSIKADLDGDGVAEAIEISGGENEAVIRVNGMVAATLAGDNIHPGAALVDFQTSEPDKDLVLYDGGPSDDPSYTIYRWKAGVLREIARLEGEVSFTGNGVVYVWARADAPWNWPVRERHVQLKDGRFERTHQPLQWVGQKGVAIISFPLLAGRDGGEIARLLPNSELLVAFCEFVDNRAKKGSSWCLLRSATGLAGWAPLEALEQSLRGPPHWYAD
jgi:hypothetical protein